MLKRVAMAMLAALTVGAAASAQTSSSTPAGSAGQSSAQTPAAPAAQQPVRSDPDTVSYTHLTLPTTERV